MPVGALTFANSGSIYQVGSANLTVLTYDATVNSNPPVYGNGGLASAVILPATVTGMVFDAVGNLYFTTGEHPQDYDGRRDGDGAGPLPASSGGQVNGMLETNVGFAGDGENAVGALFDNPRGLAIDAAGNLYIADTGNKRVRKVVPP